VDYGPAEISEISGFLRFGTLLLSRIFTRYLGKEENLKIAAALKGCDVMGLYELAKRGEVRLENILILGLNCGDSISPETARKTIVEKFQWTLIRLKRKGFRRENLSSKPLKGSFLRPWTNWKGKT
jgi:coenzyme F420-reducing hydrogenase beta subunit